MQIEAKYTLGVPENKAWLNEQRDNLMNFGHAFPSPGGGSYWLGDDGTPWRDRNRETWITCRMTHVYSLAAFVGHPGAEALVDAGLRGLRGELHDDANGGWYAAVTPEGGRIGTKQCYAHAFVLLASSSATLLGRPGAAELLADAQDMFLKRFWDDEVDLSVDTWNEDFSKHVDMRDSPAVTTLRLNQVWDSIPSQLAKENKKFVYGVVRAGGRGKDFESAIQWLVDASLALRASAIAQAGTIAFPVTRIPLVPPPGIGRLDEVTPSCEPSNDQGQR